MSKLDELKTQMTDLIDRAWNALEGSADVDRARALVGDATAAMVAAAHDVAEHLFYHVLNNADPQPTAITASAAATAVSELPEPPPLTLPAAEPVTGMAPPAAEAPAAEETAPAASETAPPAV